MSYYIPKEILTEILKRLPAKSLMRFRSVAKSWYSLIQSRIFNILHRNHQKNRISSDDKYILYASMSDKMLTLHLGNEEEHGEYYLPTNMIHNPTWHAISNGLICLSTMSLRMYNLDGIDYYKNIYIWNPFIHKYITLPDPPRSSAPEISVGAPLILAFGFVPKFDDYKVVKLMQDIENDKCFVDLYTLSTNSWKIISQDNLFAPFSIRAYETEVFINGAVFWIGKTDWCVYIIVCFDAENEVMREISLPVSRHSEDYRDLSLGSYGDQSLALFVTKQGFNVIIDMWVSEELGGINSNEVSWNKKFTIDLQQGGNFDFQVLGLIGNTCVILRDLQEGESCDLVSYNVQKKETKYFVSANQLSSLGLCNDFNLVYERRVTVIPFTESLVLLNTVSH